MWLRLCKRPSGIQYKWYCRGWMTRCTDCSVVCLKGKCWSGGGRLYEKKIDIEKAGSSAGLVLRWDLFPLRPGPVNRNAQQKIWRIFTWVSLLGRKRIFQDSPLGGSVFFEGSLLEPLGGFFGQGAYFSGGSLLETLGVFFQRQPAGNTFCSFKDLRRFRGVLPVRVVSFASYVVAILVFLVSAMRNRVAEIGIY